MSLSVYYFEIVLFTFIIPKKEQMIAIMYLQA